MMNSTHALKTYKRALVIRLIEMGENNDYIATLTELSPDWIRQLRARHAKEGSAALSLQKPGGSVSRLSAANIEDLCNILAKGAISYGLEGEFWDRKRVQYVIQKTFGVKYHIQHISDILAKINYTLQKPRKKDFRQDDAKVTEWTQEILPEIKKK